MMKTKECPSCAMEIDSRSKTCPVCNYEFARTPPRVRMLAILLALLFLVYLIFG